MTNTGVWSSSTVRPWCQTEPDSPFNTEGGPSHDTTPGVRPLYVKDRVRDVTRPCGVGGWGSTKTDLFREYGHGLD